MKSKVRELTFIFILVLTHDVSPVDNNLLVPQQQLLHQFFSASSHILDSLSPQATNEGSVVHRLGHHLRNTCFESIAFVTRGPCVYRC